MRIELDINPAVLSTAQQKGMHHGRVFTNPKVARSMRIVRTAMSKYAPDVRRKLDMTGGSDYEFVGVSLCVLFYFPFPVSGSRREKALRREGQPVTSARYGDLDNRVKAFQDALVQSGAIPDDRFVTHLELRKLYTTAQPRIVIYFDRDFGINLPLTVDNFKCNT